MKAQKVAQKICHLVSIKKCIVENTAADYERRNNFA
jgi:hypothetical protein